MLDLKQLLLVRLPLCRLTSAVQARDACCWLRLLCIDVPASILVHLLHVEDMHGLQVSIYLVKWKGFPSSENTWEKYEDVTIGGRGLINDFKKRQLPGASWPDHMSLFNLLSGWCCVLKKCHWPASRCGLTSACSAISEWNLGGGLSNSMAMQIPLACYRAPHQLLSRLLSNSSSKLMRQSVSAELHAWSLAAKDSNGKRPSTPPSGLIRAI